jgi:hypothetical protein
MIVNRKLPLWGEISSRAQKWPPKAAKRKKVLATGKAAMVIQDRDAKQEILQAIFNVLVLCHLMLKVLQVNPVWSHAG